MTRKKTSKSNAKTTKRTSSTRKSAKTPAAKKKASRSPKLSSKQRKAVKEAYNKADDDADPRGESSRLRGMMLAHDSDRTTQRIRVDITGYAFCDDTDIPEGALDEHGGAREAAEHALGGAELHLVIDGISFTICLEPA